MSCKRLFCCWGGEPAISGTVAASARRGWLILRAVLASPSDGALIEEWRRVQRQALRSYIEAVSGYVPERIRRTISLQVDRISDRLDEIGHLREPEVLHPSSS